MLDTFQQKQISVYNGLSFVSTSKKMNSAYTLVSHLIQDEVFYYIRYSKHSPVFYCFETKEDFESTPQKFIIKKIRELKKLVKLKPKQTTIYDFIGA